MFTMTSKIIKALREGDLVKKTKCFIRVKHMARERRRYERLRRRELQRAGQKLLERVLNALEPYNAPVFANFGTLLGLVRDGRFMKHDNDLDVGVYLNSDLTWDVIEREMAKIGLRKVHQFSLNGVVTEQTYIRKRLTLDFFAHSDGADGSSITYLYYWIPNEFCKEKNDRRIIELKMSRISGIQKKRFGSIEVSVPTNYEEYLASIYTEGWRVPDPNWIPEKGPAWNELYGVIGKIERE